MALMAGLLLTALAVALAGYSPGKALRALLGGAVGGLGPLARTLQFATPLMVVGLAVAVAFRAGVWNIGCEGAGLIPCDGVPGRR